MTGHNLELLRDTLPVGRATLTFGIIHFEREISDHKLSHVPFEIQASLKFKVVGFFRIFLMKLLQVQCCRVEVKFW